MNRWWALVMAATAACSSASSAEGPSERAPSVRPPAETVSACTDATASSGPPGAAAPIPPSGPFLTGDLGSYTAPDLRVSMASAQQPCLEPANLFVIRVGAAWCGSCRWHLAHTRELRELDIGTRLRFLDVVLTDAENAAFTRPMDAKAGPRWAKMQIDYRALIDAPDVVAVDESRVLAGAGKLPRILVVDRRRMNVVVELHDPSPEETVAGLRRAIALVDKKTEPAKPVPELVDGKFDRKEWDLIAAMARTASVPAPPDPTNEYADDASAAALGKKLFSDPALSPKNLSCATCHQTAKGFSDGLAQSVGAAKGSRNAPSITLAAHSPWFLWDGGADTLWMQAALPFEDPTELASSRVWIAHRIANAYADEYTQVFGAKYPFPDLTGVPLTETPWPMSAPGDAQTRKAITRVYVNVAKAIAAFERSFQIAEEPIDRYARGEYDALTAAQKDGLSAFLKTGCAQCHHGPRLTDDAFHMLGFETLPKAGKPPWYVGRGGVWPDLIGEELNASTEWSDAPTSRFFSREMDAGWLGKQFKTPTLRGVAKSAPYGHSGTFGSLATVIRAHADSMVEPWLPKSIDDATIGALVTFLETMNGDPIVP